MERYICIHGHFYQPPRENPWLEAVELQDSAYPYHDWNQRITSECYAPNASSRILDEKARVMNIINNYSKMSFDFGPTLLSWMEDNDPETYSAILEADRKSRKNFSGRGSAMAQPYNHMIMPLANTRDKRTQIIWGIEDFKYRFGRDPEGMWLPETAVDLETLDIMAEMGIRFIILAPHQAGRTRKIGEKKWKKADGGQVDPKMPYACLLPSRRHINVFFYDGPVSHDTAFAGLLNDGVTFSGRLTGLFSDEGEEAQVVHIATDGETYGHHHRFGEMALSYCLFHIESNGSAKLTNYGEFLSKHPPMYEVEIIENSSWSCAHGVERWRSNCGCRLGFHSKWTQEWRKPLREALDWLRDMVAPLYEKEMSNYFQDPWKARDEYIRVILKRSDESIRSFLQSSSLRELSKEEVIKSIKFFEMQRHAMLMYTSCGWFFDEISGIETTQILQYAARVIQLGRELTGYDFEPQFVEMLRSAPSNIAQLKNGEGVWENYIRPTIVDLLRVGAHFGVSSLFEDYPEDSQIYCYHARSEMNIREESGRQKLAIGRAHILSEITQEEKKVCFAFLHMGDHNISGGVLEDTDGDVLKSMLDDMQDAFSRSDLTEVVGLINKHFGSQSYTIWHLFKDEQRKVMNIILET
ncbi:MAG: DUF3536 domain-containing protein, partial [Candidatus Aureabacteria bacterium]|nr:DUF3536 domain-containing protein [Candidatus Auribacterota bacterium]